MEIRDSQYTLHRGKDRLRLHHHPAAAAIGHVVRDLMFAGRVIAEVVEVHADEAGRLRALEDGFAQVGGADFGEEGEEVETQRHDGIVIRIRGGNKSSMLEWKSA